MPALHKLALAHISLGQLSEGQAAVAEALKIEPENEQFKQLAKQLKANRLSSPVKQVRKQINKILGRSDPQQ